MDADRKATPITGLVSESGEADVGPSFHSVAPVGQASGSRCQWSPSCLGRADPCGPQTCSLRSPGVKDQNHNGHQHSLIVPVVSLVFLWCNVCQGLCSRLTDLLFLFISFRLKASASKEIRYVGFFDALYVETSFAVP